jgi:serine/threonine protein kinase
LKPENLLLASKENDLDIRIADFGLARVVGSNTLIQSVVGSPNYVAPEGLCGNGWINK